jgi:hypothetical protein
MDQEIKTQIDPMSLWHKQFAERLPIVVIIKTHLHPHKTAPGVLCSSALTLGDDHWIDYYRLRFPREFNFRDATPYWGREDFMKVNARPVYHGANRAMCMVHVSHALMRPMRAQWSACSVHDLKAWFRGQQYVVETLQWLPEPPDPICIAQVVSKMAELGRVNHAVNPIYTAKVLI